MEMKRELTRYMRPARVMMLGVAVLSLAGCVKRELEIRPDEGYVEIALDWSKAQSSRSARYLFYNESGALVKEVSGVSDCFKGTLPTGVYRLIVHNTDAGQVDWQGCEKYESAEVFAKETNYSEGHHPAEGVPCIQEPREVFATGGCNESETVEVRRMDTTRLSVTPAELTKQVAIRFTVEVNGDASVRALHGVLGGVSHGFFPGKGCHNASSSCAVEFAASPETKAASGCLYGTGERFRAADYGPEPGGDQYRACHPRSGRRFADDGNVRHHAGPATDSRFGRGCFAGRNTVGNHPADAGAGGRP